MQRKAAGDLKKLVTDALVEAGLTYEGAREYWTPRRLALDVRGVDARSRDTSEERKGPRTDAPEKAIEGFLRGAGLSSIDEAETRNDPKKGDLYVAMIKKPGRAAEEIVAEAMPRIVREFPWPKAMRWGAASAEPGSLRWVRPLQSILCTFGPETEEPVVVDFEVGGIRAGNTTSGHRFHAPETFKVRRFDDYVEKLEKAFVVLDAERRKEMIRHDAENLAFARGLEIVPDEGLLDEVSGLVEWPVTLIGSFDEAFLAIPPEVVQLTIRTNQKCFVTRSIGSGVEPRAPQADRPSPGQGAPAQPPVQQAGVSEKNSNTLSNDFLLVANIEASDGGADIARGNGKVVRARLSDALYFWQTDQADLPGVESLAPSAGKFGLDLKKPLDQRMAKLDALDVTFHAKLGTQGERVQRIVALAEEIAKTLYPEGTTLAGQPVSGTELAALVKRAAVLAKADLTTEAVGEFPELQGLMGRYYAALQGEHPSVQAAIEEHYKPLGPTDRVPTDPVAICVALADKLDMLVGFWAIDEKPTGSKDPYALRRAVFGVARILYSNGIRLKLGLICINHGRRAQADSVAHLYSGNERIESQRFSDVYQGWREKMRTSAGSSEPRLTIHSDFFDEAVFEDLLEFFHDRLKTQLRDQGARHDLVDAVLSAGAAPSSGPPGHLLPAGEKNASALTGAKVAGVADQGAIPLPSRERVDASGSEQTGEGLQGATNENPTPASLQNDDLLDIARRVEALGTFLATEDGQNLLAGTRRAANILAAEEKKGTRVAAAVDPALLTEPEEKALADAIDRAESELADALKNADYAAAMAALARLRAPVDAFFDTVLVNADDEAVRANRLALLSRIRTATRQVADFGRIVG